MRLCRFKSNNTIQVGIYSEKSIVPLKAGAEVYAAVTHEKLNLADSTDLLEFLPPNGKSFAAAKKLAEFVARDDNSQVAKIALETSSVELLVPIPRPNKLFLLAGNYAKHIEEGGRKASERQETFPYVFMKPASTTLADPNKPVFIPKVSPDFIDWELELAVVIGERCKHVKEADALAVVAGYTVVNDISNRKFRPNPGRKEREQDKFFDWLHGKWMDSFCPCGPCITSADAIADPQTLELKLSLNGKVRQDSNTSQQIFPVAAVIEFISSFSTFEPGDIIATGTPAGVGNSSGTYLKPGDKLDAYIGSIGTLHSPIVSES